MPKSDQKPLDDVSFSPTSWTDVFLVLPTMCFSYQVRSIAILHNYLVHSLQAHISVVPIYLSLKTRTDCIKATLASTIVLILSYCFVAICGYLTYGIDVDHNILVSQFGSESIFNRFVSVLQVNYNPNSPAVLVAIILVAVKTYSAYPVNLFCGRYIKEKSSAQIANHELYLKDGDRFVGQCSSERITQTSSAHRLFLVWYHISRRSVSSEPIPRHTLSRCTSCQFHLHFSR